LAPDKGEVLSAAIQEICASAPRGSIEILPGKLVFEIKMTGINKASAVRELMTYPPFKGRTPIFVGDDTTDEPVFPMLSQFGGLGFSVGRIVPDVNGHFENPESVRGWLAGIANRRQNTQSQGAAS
jgi:trehalose 6-phosphate phosphatase